LTANGPPLYPFKMVIPFAGALLLLQGVVEIVRCVVCLRNGAWPAREPDVEEVDVDQLKAQVSGEGMAGVTGTLRAGEGTR
jgi:TRAP-type mannitol/chloroaromatic compound transport system permease small subunit